MTIKHKVLKDFQLLMPDKKIIILKSGAILEEYFYKTKDESIQIDSDVINSNGDYFQIIDWKQELISRMRQNKVPQPSILAKKIIPLIEEMFVISSDRPSNDFEKEYRSKLRELNERESTLEKEYRSKLRELNEMESEYEIKTQKLDKRSLTLEEEYEMLSIKESEIRKRLKEARDREESIKDMEFEIGKKERNIDKILLESEKNLDERQTEMNIKLEAKLKQIDEKEESLKIREEEIKSFDIDKILRIKEKLINYYNSIPWYHNKMESFRGGLDDIIADFSEINY